MMGEAEREASLGTAELPRRVARRAVAQRAAEKALAGAEAKALAACVLAWAVQVAVLVVAELPDSEAVQAPRAVAVKAPAPEGK
jgi:hypothetical protein